ncbi:MAG TPA: DegT/DnrJ/EryC1/StrS family aminotransferase [Chloroflexia bacterium]|nr:DegT/DnrJ/EryC1/StrS family aminotransferase [Chloroflexia bacterium]
MAHVMAHRLPSQRMTTTDPNLFVPALATLWPRMLFTRGDSARYLPFCEPYAVYFYFARNAIWRTVKMLGLEGGGVLVPAYHHGVEIEALADAGVRLRFYPVGRRWDVDPAEVARRITPETKALYLIHFAGFPGPVEEMRELADKHGVPLIEDCALSLLSAQGDKPLGSTGDVSIFCLYKTLPLPNGGALVINGSNHYDLPRPILPPTTSTFSHLMSSLLQNIEMRGGSVGRALRAGIRRLGRRTVEAANIERVTTGSDHFNREHVDLGISPISLRIIASQDMARIVKIRRRNYRFLLEQLRTVSRPLFDALAPGVCPLFYPLIVEDKEPVMDRLAARGIESIDFWRNFHRDCDPTEFPDTAWLRRSVLEIPCHQDLTLETMQQVAQAVRESV